MLALLARGAFGLAYWTDKPLTHDEREYLALATNVAQGRGFTHALPGEPEPDGRVQRFGRAPLYPLFLAPLTRVDPNLGKGRLPQHVPVSVKLAQALVGTIGVWLIALLAGRAGGPKAGLVAGAIASIHPPLVWITAYALSEALYSTLALAAAHVLGSVTDAGWRLAAGGRLEAGDGRPRPPEGGLYVPRVAEGGHSVSGPPEGGHYVRSVAQHVVLAAILAGLAALTRPAMLLFVPLACVLLWWRAPSSRVGLTRAALFALAAMMTIAPWTLRNTNVYGRPVLIASEGGVTFWTGNHPAAIGEGDLAANPHLKQLNHQFRARHAGLTEEQLEPIYYRDALRLVVSDPLAWAVLVAKKIFYTFVPVGPSYRLHSPRYFWTSVISYAALVPFAALGLRAIWHTTPPLALLTLAASSVLVCIVFFPQERFRIPVIDPTVIVCASMLVLRPGSPVSIESREAPGPQGATLTARPADWRTR